MITEEAPCRCEGLKVTKGLGATRIKAGWQSWNLILSSFREKGDWEVVRTVDRAKPW